MGWIVTAEPTSLPTRRVGCDNDLGGIHLLEIAHTHYGSDKNMTRMQPIINQSIKILISIPPASSVDLSRYIFLHSPSFGIFLYPLPYSLTNGISIGSS